MELDLSKIFNGATINISINANVDMETVKMILQLLGNSGNISINTTTEKTGKTSNEHQTPGSQSTEKKTGSEDKKKSDGIFDIVAVCKTIREYAELAKSGEDVRDTSAIMADEIDKMTNGRVRVFFGTIGRYHAIVPNFSKTPEVAALYYNQERNNKWGGWVSLDKMEDVLRNSFTNPTVSDSADHEEHESTTLAGQKRAKCHKNSGYSQGTYYRVRPGSMMMRMRCKKGSDELAPMVIDAALAKDLFDKGYTHVTIGTLSKNDVPVENSKYINLIFKKEKNRTRKEAKHKTMSRLHPYGINKSAEDVENRITTYAINGDAFQRTILNYFNETCTGLKECMFKLVPTGKENERGVAYRIEKATV